VNYRKLTDEELEAEIWRHCPPELIAKFDAHQGQANDESLVAALVEEMSAAMPSALHRALGERELRKKVLEAAAKPTPIAELLDGPIPRELAELRLPLACPIEVLSPTNRRWNAWPRVSWAELEAARGILTEDRDWAAVEAVAHLMFMASPSMRDHPGRTLAEAFRERKEGARRKGSRP
jgi:hypothetical protein